MELIPRLARQLLQGPSRHTPCYAAAITTLNQSIALLEIVSAALSRAVVQIGDLPPRLWKPLLRRLKGHLTAALLDNATPDELLGIAFTILDDLMADQEVLEVHRISILNFVHHELFCLVHGSFEFDEDD